MAGALARTPVQQCGLYSLESKEMGDGYGYEQGTWF
jgi:hypothetical protein